MYEALLFDLDGTLLPMDLDAFLKAYFNCVSRKFAHLLPPDKLVSDILHGTAAMVKDCDRRFTNREVFWASFSARAGSTGGTPKVPPSARSTRRPSSRSPQ